MTLPAPERHCYTHDLVTGHSHACINMYVEDARELWNLTARKKLAVYVHGAWS